MPEDFTVTLDAAQKEAVLSPALRLLIVAGPGAGKTRVLAARFVRLLGDGAPADEILAVTFTNRAAEEMKKRVSAMTGLDPGRLNISTLHAFCLKILKNTRPGLTLYGRAEQVGLLKGLGFPNAEKAADAISAYKNLSRPGGSAEPPDAYPAYREAMSAKGALDLDDLVAETARSLEEGAAPPILKHILVDEYQDINPAQARVLDLLAGPGATLTAIGDPDQAIYGFRGASLGAFLDFERTHPGAAAINLANNYRSPARIVEASGAVVGKNTKRIPRALRALVPGGVIRIVTCSDEKAESEFVVREIESLMGGLSSLTVGGEQGSVCFADFAVFARTNRQLVPLVEAFEKSSIPFQAIGPARPGYAELFSSIRGTPPAPGALLADHITTVAGAVGAPDETRDLLIRAAGALADKEAAAAIGPFAEELLLAGPADALEIDSDRVKIMTLHMSKGLEFRYVFLTGAEDGLMPLRLKEPTDIEEERRLFYVGMTRTRGVLYITSAEKRRLWGAPGSQKSSPFVREIPAGLVERLDIKRKKRLRRPVQNSLFE